MEMTSQGNIKDNNDLHVFYVNFFTIIILLDISVLWLPTQVSHPAVTTINYLEVEFLLYIYEAIWVSKEDNE